MLWSPPKAIQRQRAVPAGPVEPILVACALPAVQRSYLEFGDCAITLNGKEGKGDKKKLKYVKIRESVAKWWHCYKMCLFNEDVFCSLTEEYEVALSFVAYTTVKLLVERETDHDLCVVISTLVGLRETWHPLQSDFVQR